METERNYRKIAQHFEEKLKKIKVFLADVDGVLTNGHVYWSGQEVGFNRFFHVLDGYGMKVLQQAGIKVGIVSGGDSLSLKVRSEYLKLDYTFIGNEDKREAYNQVKNDGFGDEEICYMGDEFFDIPLLNKAGFSATVPNTSLEIREVVDYVTDRNGGEGAVREVIDLIRYAQGIVPEVHDFN